MLPPKTWTLRLENPMSLWWPSFIYSLELQGFCCPTSLCALTLQPRWEDDEHMLEFKQQCEHHQRRFFFFFKDLVDVWGLRHSDKEGSVSSRSAAVSLGRPGFDLLCWFFLLFPFSRLCLLDYSEYKTHWSRFHYSCQRIVRRLAPISRLSYI